MSASPLEVIQYIRFQIEQLSVRNGHHEFESLCRHLARRRVGLNILAATGPVAAGGDQGRDFETFPTEFVEGEEGTPPPNLPPSVFGCSLQQDFAGKVLADVQTAASQGRPIQRFYFYSARDIPVAKRHELEDRVRTEHGFELVLFDAHNISEQLASPDVFWIAEHYLSVPAHMLPRPPSTPEWYEKLRIKWSEGERAYNHAGFMEVRAAVRHATATEALRPDVSSWIEKLEKFREASPLRDLKRRATYEIAVAALRGQGTLVGRETELAAFFDQVNDGLSTAEIEDAIVLLAYAMGANRHGVAQFDAHRLARWKQHVVGVIETRLANATSAISKVPLLELRGFAATTVDPVTGELPAWRDAVTWWSQLEELIAEAPLYPVTEFADRITQFLDLMGPNDEILALAERLDKHVAERHGDAAVGERARDRALLLLRQGHRLQALDQLHTARARWLKGETVYGAFLSTLLLAKTYQGLGLYFAAKFHALGAAKLALHSTDQTLRAAPRALMAALESDYLLGAWNSYLHLAPFTMNAYGALEHDPDSEISETYQNFVFMTITLHAVSEGLSTDVGSYVAEWTKHWNLAEEYEALFPSAQKAWANASRTKIAESLKEAGAGEPFSDLAPQRVAKWNALGVSWVASWYNDRETTAKAEEFLGQLQVILADLVHDDLMVMPTSVELLIVDGVSTKVTEPTENGARNWTISIGPSDDNSASLLAIAAGILTDLSLLSQERILGIIESRFKNGLGYRVSIPSPYREIYADVNTEDEATESRPAAPPSLGLEPATSVELAWRSGRAPGYTVEISNELLQKRYDNTYRATTFTMQRIRAEPDILALLLAKRGEGWLDWHLMSVVAHIAINYRIRQKYPAAPRTEVLRSELKKLWTAPEAKGDSVVPPSEFTSESLESYFNIMMVSGLGSLGLQCRQSTPDFPAIKRVLRERFGYFQDDIPHSDPLFIPGAT